VTSEGQRIGRYILYDAIARGGMASVHFGRMVGPGGFARTVVIKRLHAHLAQDAEFGAMFMDEGRLAARIRHPNVVSTIDVASFEGELLLIMEYVRGESLSRLMSECRARKERIPARVLSSIILGALYGLHAAHQAKTEQGEPLGIVHRDVSPQNVMVGADGLARVADFGVAKAASRSHSTRDGRIKGKLAYMSPEQIERAPVDRRADIYAVGVLLWEALAGRKLFMADDGAAIMHAVLNDPVPSLADYAPEVSPAMDRIVLKALSRRPADRFATALEMAEAIETTLPPALQRRVGDWVETIAGDALAARDRILAEVETSTPSDVNAAPPIPDHLVRLSEQPTVGVRTGEAPSVITAVSVSGEVGPRRRPSRRGVVVALSLVGVCVVIFSLVRTLGGTSTASPPVAMSVPASAAPDPPSAPRSSAVSAVASASVSAADPSAAPRPSATPPSPARAQPRVARPKGGRARPGCDPPLVVGPDGIERFKPGCL